MENYVEELQMWWLYHFLFLGELFNVFGKEQKKVKYMMCLIGRQRIVDVREFKLILIKLVRFL